MKKKRRVVGKIKGELQDPWAGSVARAVKGSRAGPAGQAVAAISVPLAPPRVSPLHASGQMLLSSLSLLPTFSTPFELRLSLAPSPSWKSPQQRVIMAFVHQIQILGMQELTDVT